MTCPHGSSVTRLLQAVRAGTTGAADELLAAVYGELRTLARARMRGESPHGTLQATALVHEAWLRLRGSECDFDDRRHFFGAASRVMRQLLVERYRRRHRHKHGGDAQFAGPVADIEIEAAPELAAVDLVALDDALTALEQQDPRMAQIVQLRFFGGLSVRRPPPHWRSRRDP